MEDAKTPAEESKAKPAKHITIKGKPLCRCRLSDKQFAKMAELVGGRWTCTYDFDDPKLDVVVNALKQVVKDPNTVEVHEGVHFESLPGLPPGMMAAVVPPEVAAQLLKAINGGPPGRSRIKSAEPDDDAEGGIGESSFSA